MTQARPVGSNGVDSSTKCVFRVFHTVLEGVQPQGDPRRGLRPDPVLDSAAKPKGDLGEVPEGVQPPKVTWEGSKGAI